MSLISYFITGSRTVVELRSKLSPSGSYTTLLKCLYKYSQQSNKIPNDTDIVISFYNNQVLARNLNVKYDIKVMVCVVTTLISLCPPTAAKLQRTPALSPKEWLHEVNVGYGSHFYKVEDIDNLFWLEKKKQFFADPLFEIVRELRYNNGNVKDGIDKVTEKKSKFNDCEGKPDVTVLNPIDLNPYLYESVPKVMNHIQKESNRDWNIIGFTGLPYLLCA